MAKKVKTVVNYHIKDLVVVRSVDFEGNVKHEIAMITNKHYATNLQPVSYDMRTEGGSGLLRVAVDGKKKCKQYICSALTHAWIEDGGSNNMWIHKRDGHTRANYADSIQLVEDGGSKTELGPRGEKISIPSIMKVHQFEKYNDFIFSQQGPRSY